MARSTSRWPQPVAAPEVAVQQRRRFWRTAQLAAACRDAIDERQRRGIEATGVDGADGERPDPALDVERCPLVGRREVDGLRADVAAEVGLEAAEPRPG